MNEKKHFWSNATEKGKRHYSISLSEYWNCRRNTASFTGLLKGLVTSKKYMTIINQRFSQYKKLIVSVCVLVLWSVFSKVLKSLMADSTRDELLAFIQQYGSHYISEALYGSELTCNIYFPSKKSQQQLWLQYQKGKTEVKESRRR